MPTDVPVFTFTPEETSSELESKENEVNSYLRQPRIQGRLETPSNFLCHATDNIFVPFLQNFKQFLCCGVPLHFYFVV